MFRNVGYCIREVHNMLSTMTLELGALSPSCYSVQIKVRAYCMYERRLYVIDPGIDFWVRKCLSLLSVLLLLLLLNVVECCCFLIHIII